MLVSLQFIYDLWMLSMPSIHLYSMDVMGVINVIGVIRLVVFGVTIVNVYKF